MKNIKVDVGSRFELVRVLLARLYQDLNSDSKDLHVCADDVPKMLETAVYSSQLSKRLFNNPKKL